MWLFGLLAFLISVIATYVVREIARFWHIEDKPDQDRKRHGRTVPLLGGVALFLSFWTVVFVLLFIHPIFGIEILKGKLVAAFLASLVIIIIGVLDDIYNLPALPRLIAVAVAIFSAVVLGLGLEKITNPFGGVFNLSATLGGVLVIIWLLFMTYTTKLTDGLDGLAMGISAIGAIIIFFMTRSKEYFQPNVALLALIFAAVGIGFLLFNFHPASIFLGEGGSLFVGFMLGVLAVISGGKVATTLLVMAIPAFDIARVVYRRMKNGQKIFQGDRRHLHFRLQDSGLADWKVVVVYYAIAALLGIFALTLKSGAKMAVILILVFITAAVAVRLPESNN